MDIDDTLEYAFRGAVASSIGKDGVGFIQCVEELQTVGFRTSVGLVLPILASSIDTLVEESDNTDRTIVLVQIIEETSGGTVDWLGYTWPIDIVSGVMYYAARASHDLPVPDEDRQTAESILLSTIILCIASVLSRGPRRWNRQLDFVEDSLAAAS